MPVWIKNILGRVIYTHNEANLRGADLREANLRAANLGGANLCGANLRGQALIIGPIRSDGYIFLLSKFEGEGLRIKAGCRDFQSFAAARAHWQSTRSGTALGDETMAILDFLERMAVGRGFIAAPGPSFGGPDE